ncbi:hypothetical protein LC613_13895 [Nostoc sphaeroides CHAB 2801]|uniref:hypothetical protein n=1 Tax=Nostoc sphaeroides TaxID=446679 RepID=UPI000E4A4BC9|nr:hypothetical protein [Nostoc sphaeroides]MCC5629108.1 hypothetical protein [Nostoc sphaeroides CHAB 2801]
MKRFIFAAVATVTLVVSLSSQAIAQSKSSPVPAFLDRLGMKYVKEDEYFAVMAGVDGGRTQMGFIVPTIIKIGDVEYIGVLSVSQISKTPPNAEISKQLDSNISDPLSGWRTIDKNGMHLTLYYKSIPLKDDPDSARQEIIKILNIADTAEKDLTGKDEL